MRKMIWSSMAVVAVVFTASTAMAQQGGRPGFTRLLNAFDSNGDSALEASEVPSQIWSRMSAADADGDGKVTQAEFNGHRPGN